MSRFNNYLEIIQEQKYNYDESLIGKIKGFFNKEKDSNQNNIISITNISGFNFLYGNKKIETDKKIDIHASKIRIGRDDKSNDINIPDCKFISSKHLEIEYVELKQLHASDDFKEFERKIKGETIKHSNYGFKITDLNSTNGTRINGQHIGKGQSKIIFMTQFENEFEIGTGKKDWEFNFIKIKF
jgi:pSer/pThr/pTyr-binding forkhead associated (FHA) protein